MDLKPSDWQDVCKAMDRIGFKLVIVQAVEYVGDDGVPYTFYEKNGTDPIAVMLRYGEPRGIKIHVGLRLVQGFDKIRKDKAALDRLLAENRAVAAKIWSRYGRSGAFGGFYIPQELANYGYTDEEIRLLKGYFGPLGRYSSKFGGGKVVSVSPYFNPDEGGLADPARFASDLKAILSDSGIGVIMLQDGVGVREIKAADIGAKVVPFYREVAKALGPGQTLWGNVECLEHRNGKDFPVTDYARFEAQRRAVGGVACPLVTFEFFNYMNPYGHTKPDKGYVEAEKALYEAYSKEVGGK
jgi:hypothetical protein